MDICFVVIEAGKSKRLYHHEGNYISLVANPAIRIPVKPQDDPIALVRAQEEMTWRHNREPFHVEQIKLALGSYFPSIARPFGSELNMLNPAAGSGEEFEKAKAIWRELGTVTSDIESGFDILSPSEMNFNAYGNYFEKQIFFSSIGVENLFRKIFEDNNISAGRLTTNDFVRLNKHLRLDEYSLSFVRYPWMEPVKPFGGWSPQKPTESLPWFHAYNLLKHDKWANQSKATLGNAISAACAYYTLAFAVFGNNLFPGYLSDNFELIFSSHPQWGIAEYYHLQKNEKWSPRFLTL